MTHITADRVKDTTTTAGTGNITVSGTPPTGFRTLSAVLTADGNTCWACIEGGGEWEVCLLTRVSANVYSRGTPLASSNSGAAVSFASGTKNVFVTAPAGTLFPTPAYPPVDNNYFLLGMGSAAGTTSGLAADTLYLCYDVLETDVRVDEIGLAVGVSVSGGLIRIGIWDEDPVTHLPTGAPLIASGALDAATTGNKIDVVSPVTLRAGGKWIGVVNNNTAVRHIGGNPLLLPLKRLGAASSTSMLNATSAFYALQIAHTFGALPDLTGDSFTHASSLRGAIAILRAAA